MQFKAHTPGRSTAATQIRFKAHVLGRSTARNPDAVQAHTPGRSTAVTQIRFKAHISERSTARNPDTLKTHFPGVPRPATRMHFKTDVPGRSTARNPDALQGRCSGSFHGPDPSASRPHLGSFQGAHPEPFNFFRSSCPPRFGAEGPKEERWESEYFRGNLSGRSELRNSTHSYSTTKGIVPGRRCCERPPVITRL